jgi:hypothetical protein
MDLLIDLIIFVVKQMTKDRPPRISPPGFQEIERQKAATEQRIREIQQAVAQQQSRTKPAKPKRKVPRAAAPAAGSLTQPPAKWTTPAPAPKVPPVVASSRARAPISGLRIPLIMGEILAPPVALREQEF